MLFTVHLSSHMQLVATSLGSTGPEHVIEASCLNQFQCSDQDILLMEWPLCFGAWMMLSAPLHQL